MLYICHMLYIYEEVFLHFDNCIDGIVEFLFYIDLNFITNYFSMLRLTQGYLY